jgi:protein-L-isoaspartate(D-aspartate) O-methyltransferase
MNHTRSAASPEALRARIADQIVQADQARSDRVEAALREVPRHEFVPAASVGEAYADQVVITKRASSGASLSCASVPGLVAAMLDQLDIRPGDRILEIGAGTGYNAALLAHLTGPSGQVTTLDIDNEITMRARQTLETTGYRQVTVITRDGALGAAEHAPYDRIIVTAGAWDLPSAWREQLAPAGRLVAPLRWRGQTRSIAFTPWNDWLRSDSVELCGFVPMIDQDAERTGPIDPDGHIALHWDAGQPIDPGALADVLAQEKTAAWRGVTVGVGESFDGVWLRLTARRTRHLPDRGRPRRRPDRPVGRSVRGSGLPPCVRWRERTVAGRRRHR